MSGPRALVLASTSRYRRALLERLEVPFELAEPTFDERSLDDAFRRMEPTAFALAQALGKARSVAEGRDALVLAADQIAIHPGPPPRLLTKPGTVESAVKQLVSLAGSSHRLVTGVVLLDSRTGAHDEAVDEHRLTMRAFGRSEARAYVERHRPLDCVGAYRIEDAGIKLFSRLEGEDATGIVGLPLLAVARLFRRAGLLPGP